MSNLNLTNMHLKLEDLTVALDSPLIKAQMQPGFGGMTAIYWKTNGIDSRPMTKGLPHDCCTCPHWGYMLKGSMRLEYDDGKNETVHAGDIFYFPAGHNGIGEGEAEWLEFSPEKELNVVMQHIAGKS